MNANEFMIDQERMFKLADYFHDGSILDIKYLNNDISINIESSEISEDEFLNIFPECQINFLCFDKDFPSIKGTLYLESVTSAVDKILENNNQSTENNSLKMHEEDGEILDLEISKNELKMFVLWHSYSTKKMYSSIININYKRVKWINNVL